MDIVLNQSSPQEVEAAIKKLLSDETPDFPALYAAIIQTLRELEPSLKDSQRTVKMVGGALGISHKELASKGLQPVADAIQNLANASQGAMNIRGENIHIYVSLDELERRVAGLTKQSGEPRRLSNFRDS